MPNQAIGEARARGGSDWQVRPLTAADFERVVAIDRAIVGRSRRGFYEKRLAATRQTPAAFIALGAHRDGRLEGFVLAAILDGEFGGRAPVAVLDAIGVDPAAQGRGAGHALTKALDAAMRQRGVRELQSETAWANDALLRFFAAAGFKLAPRLILERPVSGFDVF